MLDEPLVARVRLARLGDGLVPRPERERTHERHDREVVLARPHHAAEPRSEVGIGGLRAEPEVTRLALREGPQRGHHARGPRYERRVEDPREGRGGHLPDGFERAVGGGTLARALDPEVSAGVAYEREERRAARVRDGLGEGGLDQRIDVSRPRAAQERAEPFGEVHLRARGVGREVGRVDQHPQRERLRRVAEPDRHERAALEHHPVLAQDELVLPARVVHQRDVPGHVLLARELDLGHGHGERDPFEGLAPAHERDWQVDHALAQAPCLRGLTREPLAHDGHPEGLAHVHAHPRFGHPVGARDRGDRALIEGGVVRVGGGPGGPPNARDQARGEALVARGVEVDERGREPERGVHGDGQEPHPTVGRAEEVVEEARELLGGRGVAVEREDEIGRAVFECDAGRLAHHGRAHDLQHVVYGLGELPLAQLRHGRARIDQHGPAREDLRLVAHPSTVRV